MLPWVFYFIAVISAEAARVEVFYQSDISCQSLLAFIHFMGIGACNEWAMVTATHNVAEKCSLM